jgi:hypothetical protein
MPQAACTKSRVLQSSGTVFNSNKMALLTHHHLTNDATNPQNTPFYRTSNWYNAGPGGSILGTITAHSPHRSSTLIDAYSSNHRSIHCSLSSPHSNLHSHPNFLSSHPWQHFSHTDPWPHCGSCLPVGLCDHTPHNTCSQDELIPTPNRNPVPRHREFQYQPKVRETSTFLNWRVLHGVGQQM